MDAAAPRPSDYKITADTTELAVEIGNGSELVLHLEVTEAHKWFGIGGRSARLRRPRRLSRKAWRLLPAVDYLQCAAVDFLQCGEKCRRLMVQMTMKELRKDQVFCQIPTSYWDDAVPLGIEAQVAEHAAALYDGCHLDCRCEVSFGIQIDFVYYEPEELLQACCVEASGGDLVGIEDAPPCAICLEEVAPGAEETTWLPGCAHGFHGGCIGRWFEKASTCPVCRRDKLQYLPQAYRDMRDMILSDPEGECYNWSRLHSL